MSGLTPDRSSFPFDKPGPFAGDIAQQAASPRGPSTPTRPLTPYRMAPKAPRRNVPGPIAVPQHTPSPAPTYREEASPVPRVPFKRTYTDDSSLTVDTRERAHRAYNTRMRDEGMIPLQLLPAQGIGRADTSISSSTVAPYLEPDRSSRGRRSWLQSHTCVAIAITTGGALGCVLMVLVVSNTVHLAQLSDEVQNSTLASQVGAAFGRGQLW
ncbi:MAG: hypothetical protein EOO40_02540 [Deltaproteobacteria bacterium]|nr:MAG: hypothetical protein EOO40_02540 [Deltaproteobacteria bacterium]